MSYAKGYAAGMRRQKLDGEDFEAIVSVVPCLQTHPERTK